MHANIFVDSKHVRVLIPLLSFPFFPSSPEYKTPDTPRVVMNKLELIGYKVVAMTGVGQTCIWTLHRADPEKITEFPSV